MTHYIMAAQKSLPLVFALLLLNLLYTYGIPLSGDGDGTLCPKGWYHYERFCVTGGKGESENAVAAYCAGFGGIGIRGLCVIKANVGDPVNELQTTDRRSTDAESDCPEGWTHYKRMCVYKPMSVEERCHKMESVEFNGLCLKHSTGNIQRKEEEKRICCCADISAKPNGYGC